MISCLSRRFVVLEQAIRLWTQHKASGGENERLRNSSREKRFFPQKAIEHYSLNLANQFDLFQSHVVAKKKKKRNKNKAKCFQETGLVER
jgi:hypothetical protein